MRSSKYSILILGMDNCSQVNHTHKHARHVQATPIFCPPFFIRKKNNRAYNLVKARTMYNTE